jgi:hypothetical protein
MDDFLKMDVFFAVTTVAVLVLSILGGIVFLRVLRILKTLERILEIAEKETERVRDDLEGLRAKAKRDGLKLRHVVSFLGGLTKSKKRSKS